ncbi:aldehyde dehydrogenase family protein [Streptomyces sp. NPDC001635]
MGPVVSEQQLATVTAAIKHARAEGTTITAGGEVLEGLMLAPTVLTGLSQKSTVAREEICLVGHRAPGARPGLPSVTGTDG